MKRPFESPAAFLLALFCAIVVGIFLFGLGHLIGAVP